MNKARKRATRALLKTIVKELNNYNRTLWDILTALRGPDYAHHLTLKLQTTAGIRRVLGLKEGRVGAVVSGERTIKKLPVGGDHFASHVNAAADALKKLGYRFTHQD